MPELIIILCLAIALFLLLRHYPMAKEAGNFQMRVNFKKIIDLIPKKAKKRDIEKIKSIITDGQSDVIAPVHIESAVKTFREKDPEVALKLYQAEEAFLANDLRLAEDSALEAIMKNKRCGQAYVVIGKIAFFRGQFDDAKESFKTAIKCDKEIGEAYFGLGRTELREENFSKALEYLQKATNLEKNNAEWYAELGRAFMGVRQYSKAAKVLKRATQLDIESKEYRDLATEAEEKQRTHSFYTRLN